MSDTMAHRTDSARRKALGLTMPPGPAPTVAADPAGDAALVIPPALAARGPVAGRASARADRVMIAAFAVLLAGATLLQCFGLPLTGGSTDATIAVIVPIMALVLPVMCWVNPPRIDPVRLALYLLTMTSAGLSTALFADQYSPASLALFAVLYLPAVLAFEVSEGAWLTCLGLFSTVMIALTGAEFVQHAMQIVAGPQSWPNPWRLLPANLLVPGYNYLQPLVWGSRYDKPQAFVFLETSLLSQYIALALIIEVMLFRRAWRMALFAAGLFATFAGTGLLLVALALPVVLGRANMRTMAIAIVVLFLATMIAVETGWFQIVANRLTEYQQTGASANHRFVEPFQRMTDIITRPSALYSGIGAGQIEKSTNYQFWPVAKVVIEYGYLTGALFLAFFLRVMFDSAPSRLLAFALVVWFSLEGALLTAINPFMCMMLSSFFLVRRRTVPRRRPPR